MEIRNWTSHYSWGDVENLVCDYGVLKVQFTDGSDVGFLVGLGVHPDHRRQGIGRALVERAEDIIIERGRCQVRLDVDRDKPENKEFWTRLGYSRIDDTDDRYELWGCRLAYE